MKLDVSLNYLWTESNRNELLPLDRTFDVNVKNVTNFRDINMEGARKESFENNLQECERHERIGDETRAELLF